MPGYPGFPGTEDLVAVWKSSSGERFTNYRAVFTVLDIAVVWLVSLAPNSISEPPSPRPVEVARDGEGTRPWPRRRPRLSGALTDQAPDTDLTKKM